MGNVTGLRKAATGLAWNALASELDYDPFGKELRSGGKVADRVPFHLSSKFTDPETGLNYFGYRYYKPEWGRWLNRDPIEERGGLNLYCFADNAPTQSYDMLGLTNCYASQILQAKPLERTR